MAYAVWDSTVWFLGIVWGWLEHLNDLSSLVLVGATIVYVRFTRDLFRETQRMRRLQEDPRVLISIEPSEHWVALLNLVVRNTGNGVAHDIRFSVGGDFEYAPGKLLSQLSLIQRGLPTLVPGGRWQFFLTNMTQDFERKMASPFSITATYRGDGTGEMSQVFVFDFSPLEGLKEVGRPPLISMAGSLKKLQESVERAMSGIQRLPVVAYTKADLEQERRDMEARRELLSREEDRPEGE